MGIEPGQTTPDRKFTLDATRCIGCCGLAPVLTVNEEVYGKVTVDDVDKIQLLVGEVLSCEPVKKAKKLLVMQVRVGAQVRQIVSGIAKYYKPEEMVGKKVVVVANLKPAKLCGMLSEGMLLAAGDDADHLAMVTVDRDMVSGSTVS